MHPTSSWHALFIVESWIELEGNLTNIAGCKYRLGNFQIAAEYTPKPIYIPSQVFIMDFIASKSDSGWGMCVSFFLVSEK